MSESQLWNDVDDYLIGHLSPHDEVLEATLRDSDAAGLPQIAVSAAAGKLLHLLARIQGATRILEIGTLGGYSTIQMARALPADGRLITLEYSPKHAEVAGRNIARAGLDKIVEIRVGTALDSLAALADENAAPFDLVFIDADKANNPNYVDWALKLTRPGSLIIVDNVVRNGRVADPANTDPDVVGTRAAIELIGSHPRLSGTAIQTVGEKGYDGFALARVTD
ncbi:O-methyltransferase [Streptomyces sp. MBT53]|uniref:O-methyltransferase n=1 Tax=Streptomyces sp. MBT53 TaxID=1488384 RepID=UPI0019121ECB|nr:O-methyltransferase [Streptomyces sp. MBT53]MBK6014406.1 O-methyltransferase [Streptomyces sp. MBT53]